MGRRAIQRLPRTLWEVAASGNDLFQFLVLLLLSSATLTFAYSIIALGSKIRLQLGSPSSNLAAAVGLYTVILNLFIMISLVFFDIVQMVASIIQALVATGTFLLALLAFSSLGEAQKSTRELANARRIEHLRMMLSEIYSPIVNDYDIIGKAPRLHGSCRIYGYEEFITRLRKYAYLSGPKLRPYLEAFLYEEGIGGYDAKGEKCKDAAKKMKAVAQEEYIELRDELERLVGGDSQSQKPKEAVQGAEPTALRMISPASDGSS